MLRNVENRLIMPQGIRYVEERTENEWYSLEDFQFPHILDKKIPGCGYTEYCLRNNLPTILSSPRKMLIINKMMQHMKEVFYFNNDLEEETDTGKDLTKIVPDLGLRSYTKEEAEEIKKTKLPILFNQLEAYLNYCKELGQTPKILVTYDSYRHVKRYLKEIGLFDNFYTIVDEFQSIFVDSRFKSTTEMEFVNQLKDVQRVCYVSATPMIDSYLKDLEDFKDLPYYELDWETEDPSRVIKPDLKVRTTQSITGSATKIIKEYKEGRFESAIMNGNLVVSDEAVFYVNSVNNIISIIKKNELTPEECNILCANTEYNEKKIKKRLGRKFDIGIVPLKGEPHKMFTFCTRTVYLGADFYSIKARTFVLSDANIDSLAVDITLDLPQILGRQRLNENPWKNRAELFYKTLRPGKVMTREEFNKIIDEKQKRTENLLDAYSTANEKAKGDLARKFEKDAKLSNYNGDYVAVNRHRGKIPVPCINHLVKIAEQRAFDIQQVDYKDRFTVFNTIRDNGLIKSDVNNNIHVFLEGFEELPGFREKMRALCECSLTEEERCIILDQIPLTYKNYYLSLGPNRCRALSYDVTRISQEYSDLVLFNKEDLINTIYSVFKEGEKYAMSDIKITLGNIYKSLGYNKSPKATDLEEYFELKQGLLTNSDGKRVNAFELIKKKGGTT